MSRTKNAVRNMIFGVILRVFQTLIPFVIRTVMIYSLGVAYVGLNGLFVSVLQILNIAELGISSAMMFSMYEPIAKKNDEKVCQLLKLYKRYFFHIGLVILILGLCFLPFVPILISGEVPKEINLYYLFLMYLISTVLSYWLFAYRGCILEVNQRNDIISKIQIVFSAFQFVLQMVVLVCYKNYYLYIILQLLIQVFQQFIVYFYAKKIYKNLKPKGELDLYSKKKITQKIKNLATAKFGAIILNSSDIVVISSCLGLTTLAMYQNYFFIINAVISVLASVMYGTLAGIGNSLVLESKEKNYSDFEEFSFLLSWVICVCISCFLCLLQPFIEMWLGKNMLLPFSFVVLFCVYFFLYEYNQLFNLYKDAAGLWHKDRFRPLLTSIINLLMNLFLVDYIGLYGIIFSTIISMIGIGMPWLLYNLFSTFFQQKLSNYLKSIFEYCLNTIVACMISYFIVGKIVLVGIVGLIVKGILALIVPCCYYLLYYRKNLYLKKSIVRMKKIVDSRR